MKLVEMPLQDFLEELGSASPAPGGGSAAALAGALAAALCAMVGRMTVGKEKLKDSWSDMEKLIAEAGELEARLRQLVDEDTRAFSAVMAARRLPQGSRQEREARTQALQSALLASARAPLSTLASIRALLPLCDAAARRGNPGCITDAGAAAELARAGAVAASWNVRVNLDGLESAAIREELRAETEAELRAALEQAEAIARLVDERLKETV